MKNGKTIRVGWFVLCGLLVNILWTGCSAFLPSLQVSMPSPEPTSQSATAVPHDIQIEPLWIDDYLTNPGIGWQDGPEPFGIMNVPETVSYSNRRLIGWAMLNPDEGVYDWSELDNQLNVAVRDHKQFSFRVYTYVGEDYDGAMIPSWVIDQGAVLLPSGEPDYSNCVYQEHWGRFVSELIGRYDGNPDVAFIDISGYGNFNEWSWQDEQTQWDEQWMMDFAAGTASANSFQTLDGQARRRLADMFIGGAFDKHSCRMGNGEVKQVKYAYLGFQDTQLLMPYAGIIQSSQYAYLKRRDIGFRHDCLGRESHDLFGKISSQTDKIWRTAPVVYELCKPDQIDPEDIEWLLQQSHASIVHNNNWSYSRQQLEEIIVNVGYRYFLKSTRLKTDLHTIELTMEWQNVGFAPNYPKMGQEFLLYFYLLDPTGALAFQQPIQVDTSLWLPAPDPQLPPASYWVNQTVQLPSTLSSGTYQAAIAVIDQRTGRPINLSFAGRNEDGLYILSPITLD